MPKCRERICDSQITLRKPTTNLIIDYGYPVFMVSWCDIKCMITALYILNGIVIIISLCVLYAAQKIALNISEFINMITIHYGFFLSVCLFVVGIICLFISFIIIYAIRISCNKCKNECINNVLFILIILCLIISVLVIVLSILHFSKKASLENEVYDGILEGMQQYKFDYYMKKKIDTLQLTFQCCGSSGYNDWFNIKWYDSPSLACMENLGRDDTPFSCCSMHSAFPCIHHNILSVGTAYLYAPETNLSISEYGCLPILICYTKLLSWRTATCFIILGILLLIIAILTRFVQSAHMEFYRFHRNCYWHTSWLFGAYKGSVNKKCRKPPVPPPFPCELRCS